MLVLTRASGESVRVGEMTITVVRVVGGRVRIGIEAPDHVPISRADRRPVDLAAPSSAVPPARSAVEERSGATLERGPG